MNLYELQIKRADTAFTRLLDELHREAVADSCPGDITIGWDWATLSMVKPDVFSALRGHQREAIEARRALRSAGLY